ncbi:uncharacterized protein LOC131948392 [Physella acuta]|uniref:uncharacterized protein LOC131948392 n=1 Tax=Physella acuta TaxID=109671 RepID=UPI0027DD0656|nr:uncharacterized protein LOC131948392 [Physella acuta]XP_059165979.1 uncharacterized protein LOC131948392 [Physella acuta]
MSLGKFNLIVAACLLYSMCYATNDCIPYVDGDLSTEQVAAINSEHDCFLACAANSKCFSFEYDGVCTNYVLKTPVTTSSDYINVAIRCLYSSSQCSAYPAGYNSEASQTVTFDECIQLSIDNHKSNGFTYVFGKCILNVFIRDKLNTTIETAGFAYLRCERAEETTTTSTTAAMATSTTRKNCKKG